MSAQRPVYDDYAEDWERMWALWCHLGPLIAGVGVLASSGVAFFVPALVALVLWLVKKDESPFVDDHGREAVNFQISLAILFVGTVVIGILTCGLGWFVAFPVWLALALIGMVRGALAAGSGRYYRYPACIRVLA